MKHHSNTTKKYFRIPILVFAALETLTTTGCQTNGKSKNEKMVEVLNAEDQVIDTIAQERARPDVKEKISNDANLAEAERRLERALASLRNANERMRGAIQNDQPNHDH